jgi:hypothetical protein
MFSSALRNGVPCVAKLCRRRPTTFFEPKIWRIALSRPTFFAHRISRYASQKASAASRAASKFAVQKIHSSVFLFDPLIVVGACGTRPPVFLVKQNTRLRDEGGCFEGCLDKTEGQRLDHRGEEMFSDQQRRVSSRSPRHVYEVQPNKG